MLAVTRLGKRIVLALSDDLYLVLHLMIAGRLHWLATGAKAPGRITLAAFEFTTGRWPSPRPAPNAGHRCIWSRARLRLPSTTPAVSTWHRCDRRPHSRTGCGARITPQTRTDRSRDSSAASATPIPTRSCIAPSCRPLRTLRRLDDAEIAAALRRARAVTRANGPQRLRAEAGDGFPEKVTAFRAGNGRARPLWQALPGVRLAGAAHRLCRKRNATTARAARRAASCSRTARCRGCCTRAGRSRSTIASCMRGRRS